ncbi:hypothetical protein G7K_2554-t1 [Saitoella complicata NRRL Y-17804]|uniref:Uncharacterized protein n=1 Tax=Saitoella complicata (strain BCRC 22490 / CBS 7301 / JCM 7358 / NBRC 10748 / NRRL Y-17804) TaxID=698492 RepID=A0A0E9NFB7_SAICN|nr:hypothetical protein G7K_2554-t1 [Saitoella complicata NRRL Y-17804]
MSIIPSLADTPPQDSGRSSIFFNAATPWDASKCHRTLRPLKSKIQALSSSKRTSPTDYASGNAVEATEGRVSGSTQHRQSGPFTVPLPPRRKITKKYSATSSTKPANTSAATTSSLTNFATGSLEYTYDSLLQTAKANAAPALAAAYVSIFVAFRMVLQTCTPSNSIRHFSTLAERAAAMVGRCITWTEGMGVHQDEWYDSMHSQYRRTAVVGQAMQFLAEEGELLRELLPALIAVSVHHEEREGAAVLLQKLIEMTRWEEEGAQTYRLVEALAKMCRRSWILKAHLTQTLTIELMLKSAFTEYIVQGAGKDEHSGGLLASALEFSARKYKGFKRSSTVAGQVDTLEHVIHVLGVELIKVSLSASTEETARRAADGATSLLALYFNTGTPKTIEIDNTQPYKTTLFPTLAAGMALRSHQLKPSAELLTALQSQLRRHATSLTDDSLWSVVFEAYSSSSAFRSLIGDSVLPTSPTLAANIATCWAMKNPFNDNDAATWAAGIERKAMKADSGSEGRRRWKFDGILDAWVAATPVGVSKQIVRKGPRKVMRDKGEDDELLMAGEDETMQEDGEDEAENDSRSSSPETEGGLHVYSPSVPALASARKPSAPRLDATIRSAKMVRKWFKLFPKSDESFNSPLANRNSSAVVAPSPLAKQTEGGLKRSLKASNLAEMMVPSPVPVKRKQMTESMLPRKKAKVLSRSASDSILRIYEDDTHHNRGMRKSKTQTSLSIFEDDEKSVSRGQDYSDELLLGSEFPAPRSQSSGVLRSLGAKNVTKSRTLSLALAKKRKSAGPIMVEDDEIALL